MSTAAWFHALWADQTLAHAATFFADYGIYISAFALVATAWLHRGERGLLLPFVLGAIAAGALDIVMGRLFFELRPFVVMHVTPLISHNPADNSFPSDHAAATAYVAAFLCFVDRRWAVVAVLAALLVGVARVFVLVHWPHDVLVGWALGAAVGVAAGWYAAKRRNAM